ncbi:heterokaryon incompatibility protein-domain-containing protein [Aspergillus welwitschiae]|uniref:Heterokaryon incompatibility protein-domain-containing protein n=1 Tax=Aspergillus welwitschiae TaxID=1341132 RepID=A0A3F3PH61_9EURO|nr:heterokaryon incompatibility protein-domain-containing protein [Aspergillus welwitschiae]RDH26218.1 heterokaryon incompatibility protein-domain-containing protein [Aspergillus welwitschiae]
MTSGSAYAGWIHETFVERYNQWSCGTDTEVTNLIAGCKNKFILGTRMLLGYPKTAFRQYFRSKHDSETISHYLVHRAIDNAYISIDRRQSSTFHISSYLDLQKKYKNSGYTHRLLIINRFDVLRQWLGLCDKQHSCMQERRQVVPKRVIFVGTDHSDHLQLQESAHITQPFDYITLSHCWGKPTDEEMEKFRTTPRNYEKRLEGFSYHSLPKVFQDAITVTRELNKQYLSIDALCIIQGDQKDWEEEGARMDKVFASAYCTIASSSASGWNDGFLNRTQDFCQSEVVNSLGQKNIDDFCKLVDEGQLHTRAWVLQERALSRRTIYFTAQQTYWECGRGVRCENFTTLRCPITRLYLLDSRFPERLVIAGYKSVALFLQELITDYSRRDLTFPEKDKVVAFSGIAERIKEALATEVRYGVFRCFLPRLLLWKRAGMVPRHQSLSFDNSERGINIEVRQLEDCYTRERDGEHIIFTKTKKVEVTTEVEATKEVEVGILHFDMGSAAEVESRNCVVIAMSQDDDKDDPNKEYYILAVQRTSGKEEYERLGVGRVRACYVSKGSIPGKLL